MKAEDLRHLDDQRSGRLGGDGGAAHAAERQKGRHTSGPVERNSPVRKPTTAPTTAIYTKLIETMPFITNRRSGTSAIMKRPSSIFGHPPGM